MDEPTLRQLIDDVRSGATTPDAAVEQLRRLPFAEVGDALVDHHRVLRQGMPEAIYGRGKSAQQCVDIVGELLAHGSGPVLLTRADQAQIEAVVAAHGPGERASRASVVAAAIRIVRLGCWSPAPEPVMSTSSTNAYCGRTAQARSARRTSASPALHRLLANIDRITSADAVVVVAGMEGAPLA